LEKVGLHSGKPTQKEIEWVKKNRPEFINELERRKSVLFGW
jgi:hypothetical protein